MTTRLDGDARFGTPCESWQLQVGLDGATDLIAAQAQFDAAAFHVVPAAALHVTVLPLIDAAETFPTAKSLLWDRHGPDWQAAIALACMRLRPFRLRFTRLRVDARAVIAMDEANPFAALRRDLAGACALPQRPVRMPDITHVTLLRARRASVAPLPDRPPTVAAEIPVTRLRLVRETVFPTLAFEILAEFVL
ncbi:hypothetical protein GWK16_06600 [Roseomonas sp. JC162]|uniref:2'-5' RNA ligase n=1 Tax=Neoroseomonas marina TaxID=1232220 RepID=A0A848E9R0_9PROT|nr:2'-5' RNA ligase family protein [Neoroseomonas marina]NMJ40902.1 hypothetical protein [Neoroseomonas marina]